MNPTSHGHSLCQEMAGELRDMTGWLSTGELDAESFRRAVEALEARKLARFGFRLASRVLPNGGAHFTLSFADTGKVCSSFEVDLQTGFAFLDEESSS